MRKKRAKILRKLAIQTAVMKDLPLEKEEGQSGDMSPMISLYRRMKRNWKDYKNRKNR